MTVLSRPAVVRRSAPWSRSASSVTSIGSDVARGPSSSKNSAFRTRWARRIPLPVQRCGVDGPGRVAGRPIRRRADSRSVMGVGATLCTLSPPCGDTDPGGSGRVAVHVPVRALCRCVYGAALSGAGARVRRPHSAAPPCTRAGSRHRGAPLGGAAAHRLLQELRLTTYGWRSSSHVAAALHRLDDDALGCRSCATIGASGPPTPRIRSPRPARCGAPRSGNRTVRPDGRRFHDQ